MLFKKDLCEKVFQNLLIKVDGNLDRKVLINFVRAAKNQLPAMTALNHFFENLHFVHPLYLILRLQEFAELQDSKGKLLHFKVVFILSSYFDQRYQLLNRIDRFFILDSFLHKFLCEALSSHHVLRILDKFLYLLDREV